jgi:hypothetical protein
MRRRPINERNARGDGARSDVLEVHREDREGEQVMNTMSPSPMQAIKADIAKLDAAWRRADAAGNEAEKNAISAEYYDLVVELEDVAAELESNHNLGDHGPGLENPDCPTCKAIAKTEAAMVAAAGDLANREEAIRGFSNEALAHLAFDPEAPAWHEAAASVLMGRFAEKAAWERIQRDVTEEYCFLCSRATDHRGEHEPADLINEGEER